MTDIAKRQEAQAALDEAMREIPFYPQIKTFEVTYGTEGGQKTTVKVEDGEETIGACKALLALAEYLEDFETSPSDTEEFIRLQEQEYPELLELSYDEDYQYEPTLAALALKRAALTIPQLGEARGPIAIEVVIREEIGK
jgi:hypothetical protein